ncbi:hypothetical protein BD324DRAFT_653369 [Kockovaella imperatae]|uniref:TB2/DP1, HVA22 family-domain-containing protein n=1 Tax=Kockovaella imperatae TaxID=4999 RepID=A0A1Y1U993_9TREE|nr:hypothetical protein BD324DRAFT_653369 [Kockovaella imperatae]ORX34599.1 hypothetical protein BD324DRAFT_653369 [Kockovaella imperatae]
MSYQPISTRIVQYVLAPTYQSQSVTCSIIQATAKKIHRPPHVLQNAVVLLVGSILVLNVNGCGPLLSQIITFLPAVWGTLKYIRAEAMEHRRGGTLPPVDLTHIQRKWIDYWIIFSGIVMAESWVDEWHIDRCFPLWWATKVGTLFWILAKRSNPKPAHHEAHGSEKGKTRPKPLSLQEHQNSKRKMRKAAIRPPTPIANSALLVRSHEALPISAITPPEAEAHLAARLPMTIARSIVPHPIKQVNVSKSPPVGPQPVDLVISPTPLVPAHLSVGSVDVEGTVQEPPRIGMDSPPFELSVDDEGSYHSESAKRLKLPEGGLYFDNLSADMDSAPSDYDENVVYNISPQARLTPSLNGTQSSADAKKAMGSTDFTRTAEEPGRAARYSVPSLHKLLESASEQEAPSDPTMIGSGLADFEGTEPLSLFERRVRRQISTGAD